SSAGRSSHRESTSTRSQKSRTACSCTRSTSVAAQSSSGRSWTRTFAWPRERRSASTPLRTRSASPCPTPAWSWSATERRLTPAGALRVALLTRESPPDVYGGAGVHVEYLARELARLVDVTVHCWGDDRPAVAPGEPRVVAHRAWEALAGDAPQLAALQAVSIDLAMAASVEGA